MIRYCHTWFVGAILLVVASERSAIAQEAKQNRPHFYDRVEVICVGIDKHLYNKKVPDLNQAVADAKLFAAVTEKHFGFGPAKMLLNQDATKKGIEAALEEMEKREKPPEVLILYFACHGASFEYYEEKNPVPIRVGYLIPHDADLDIKEDKSRPKLWAEEAIAMRPLVDRIEKLKCKHVVLIADTCCSGFLTKRGLLATPEIKSLLSDPSRTILAATTQNESASDGVFTKELVAILEQSEKNESPLSMTDVFRQLRDTITKQPGHKMTPQMSHVGAGDGEFVFIPRSISETQVKKLKEGIAELQEGKTIDNAKFVLFRGILDRKQKMAGRQTNFGAVIAAMEALDYRYGVNVEFESRRWKEAFEGFKDNAAMGDVWAMAGLHFCYAKGLGVEKSPKDAYYWAQQADQFKKPAGVGRFLLGRCYRFGIDVPKNEVAAKSLYTESSEQGFSLGHYAMANAILQSNPKPADLRKAKELFEKVHQEGVGDASLRLAQFHLGILKGGELNVTEGIRLLEEAARKDLPDAHHALYETFARDRPGYPGKDIEKAKRHLIRAAELGLPFSQQRLATNYYGEDPFPQSLPFEKDTKLAFKWASLAAKQFETDQRAAGFAHALLAHLYERGHGVDVDAEKARYHFEEGVKLNCPYSQYYLGFRLLVSDSNYQRDFEKAFSLAKKSAAQGNVNGHYFLGHIYHHWMHPTTGKFGWRKPVDFEYHGWSHHILHHYFQAYTKGHRHKDIIDYLEAFKKWLKFEQVRGAEAFHDMASNNRLPSLVLKKLKEDYPDTYSAMEFDKKK